jgi:sugar phosphate isomerase/epimerase
MCNEAFEGRPFREVCQALRGFGYEGIEIAPFTLAADPLEIGPDRRREYREIMAGEGIGFVGLHWLLVTPKTIARRAGSMWRTSSISAPTLRGTARTTGLWCSDRRNNGRRRAD